MIKSNHRNSEPPAGGERFPCHLIRVARLDDVRPLAFENFFHGAQIEQCAVARRARKQRRMNGINAGPLARDHFRFRARHDENVLVTGRVLVDVGNLLVNIPLHPAAKRRIKLSQIANLHEQREVV